MDLDHITMRILLLYGIFSFAIQRAESQLFAEEITEKTYLAANVTVVHSCKSQYLICTQMSIQRTWKSTFVFEKPTCLECSYMDVHKSPNKTPKSVIPIFMSDELLCSPNYWNNDPVFINAARLHLFSIPRDLLQGSSRPKYSEIRRWATKKIVYDLNVPSPYSRKDCFRFNTKCSSFYHNLMYWSFFHRHSPLVQVPIQLVSGIIPSHNKIGLYLNIPKKWNNHYFANFIKIKRKIFSMSFWMYLSSPCPIIFCNILSFFNNLEEDFSSPTLLLTNIGEIHFQGKLKYKNSESAFRTYFKVPLQSWTQIVFSIDSFKWSLSLFSIKGTVVGETQIMTFSEHIELNIMKDFGIIGGSQVYNGIQGFFSEVYLHPGVFGIHRQIHESRRFVNPDLRISHEHRLQDCGGLLNELKFYLTFIRLKLFKEISLVSCRKRFLFERNDDDRICVLRIRDLKRPKIYRFLRQLIYDSSHISKTIKSTSDMEIAKSLRREESVFRDIMTLLQEHISFKVMERIKNKGIKLSSVMIKYLKDASCLGDSNAAYILATCYFYGIGTSKIDTKKALELLLINVEHHQHRLSLLALGNIHNLGLIPGVPPISATFYKAAADYTPKDIEEFSNSDMYNDNIRLTNEAQVKEHTDEDGDLFQWINHQATSGIPWAKQRLGRMLYWGAQGIRRNLNMATNFFRMAAEDPEAEPGDHFDYGLMLIKKPEKEEDFEKGKVELEIASERDPRALTVLGWLAETKEKNISKAYDYYYKAHIMGSADASFNLGIYYHYGKMPVISKDKVKAFHFFKDAAVRNQLHAGAMYSHYLLTGMQDYLPVNTTVAINWARYIGEHNPKIGYFLSEGVRAYRNKQMELSAFYYILAAFTGLELANFNLAFLCDEQEALLKRYIERECKWYHYNLTLQREEHHIHADSLIKMGDKNWYGCLDGRRDINKSIEYYVRAAKKNEPQAFFNLAFIMENQNIQIPQEMLAQVITLPNIKDNSSKEWRYDLILKLYKRCEELSENDTYLPCRLASHRIWVAMQLADMKIMIQSFVAIIISAVLVYKFIMLWRDCHRSNNEIQNLSDP